MAIFTNSVLGTNFSVQLKSLTETPCSNVYTYVISATNADSININLTGQYTNESYVSNGVLNSFNDSAIVIFNNSLTVTFAVENGGSSGVFKSATLEVINNTTPSIYDTFTFNVTRNDDSPVCNTIAAADYDQLSDTPGTKVGSALKVIRVNAAETAHEYVDLASSADLNFEYEQLAASTTWIITHNLGKFPSVSIVDSAGDVMRAGINHIDNNNLTITFLSATAGKAYLN